MNRFSSVRYRTKAASAVAILAIGSLMVAACSSSDSSAGKADGSGETITVLYPTANPGFKSVISQTLGEDFTKRTGVHVTLQTGAENYTAVNQQLLAGAAGGTLPDVAVIGLNSIETYRTAGLLQKLDGPLAKAGFDGSEIQPNAARVGVADGARYAMPYVQSLPCLIYNADDFVKAGLDPDKPPRTYSELAAAAKAIVASRAAPTGVAWAPDGDGGITFQSFVFSEGGSFLDQDGAVTFNDAKAVHALSYWSDLEASGGAKAITNATILKSFLNNDAAMWIATSSSLRAVEDGANFKVRLAPTPIPDSGKQVVPIAGAGIVAFAKNPGKLAAAGKVVAALAGTEGQVAITTNSGYLPVNESAQNDPAVTQLFKKDPNRAATLELQKYTIPWFNFPGRNATQIWDAVSDGLQSATRGESTPQQALDTAATTARDLLKQQR